MPSAPRLEPARVSWNRSAMRDDSSVFAAHSLVGIPNICRKFPVVADFLPDHDVLSRQLGSLLTLGLQRESPDFARRGVAQWRDIDGRQLWIADGFARLGPECLDGGAPPYHLGAGRKQIGVLSVHAGNRCVV